MTTAPGVASVAFSVDKNGQARGKIHGVCLELRGLPPGEEAALCHDHPGPGTTVIGSGVTQIGRTVSAKGHRGTLRQDTVFLAYRGIALILDRPARQTRSLAVRDRAHGSVRQGDYVVIDASGQVYVNGQFR